jgi:hypothetical protein
MDKKYDRDRLVYVLVYENPEDGRLNPTAGAYDTPQSTTPQIQTRRKLRRARCSPLKIPRFLITRHYACARNGSAFKTHPLIP